MTIKLNAFQRFKIQDMATIHTSTQRMVFADSLKWRALTKPIQFTDEEQKQLTYRDIPGGGTIVNGFDKLPEREFELSLTAAGLLKSLLESFPGITDKDVDWIMPILQQIDPSTN
jgi:hypothetical protein